MQELIMIVNQKCPYCKQACSHIEKLKKENPELQHVPIRIIEETEQSSEKYDHFYTPAYFIGTNKISEGGSEMEDVKKALFTALYAE